MTEPRKDPPPDDEGGGPDVKNDPVIEPNAEPAAGTEPEGD